MFAIGKCVQTYLIEIVRLPFQYAQEWGGESRVREWVRTRRPSSSLLYHTQDTHTRNLCRRRRHMLARFVSSKLRIFSSLFSLPLRFCLAFHATSFLWTLFLSPHTLSLSENYSTRYMPYPACFLCEIAMQCASYFESNAAQTIRRILHGILRAHSGRTEYNTLWI